MWHFRCECVASRPNHVGCVYWKLSIAWGWPTSLSVNLQNFRGGQQQRVALARAIIAEPQILLFDEPLSNLDRNLRESLCEEMAALLRQLGTTAVYVTHDPHEAQTLAHSIAHMNQGAIERIDQLDVVSRVTPFVA
ncbi:ATP-binding cassette domain-containing protein [Prodigiosinella aquatilis]|nr:ATP-binding cassette domain-containing protein [Prodigiosinella sp. LS101]WJV51925.1 ATP-binding cassette domain-containing protein [Prodigiosinella sp. LS101]